jgi:hypothetical protein
MAVVSCSSEAFSSVGVSDEIARAPTSGASVFGFTTTLPIAWILRPPTGSASSQYVPGSSSWSCVTKISLGSPGSTPSTPIDSDMAVVRANGVSSRPRATQILAVGRVTTRLWLSTTRNA